MFKIELFIDDILYKNKFIYLTFTLFVCIINLFHSIVNLNNYYIEFELGLFIST